MAQTSFHMIPRQVYLKLIIIIHWNPWFFSYLFKKKKYALMKTSRISLLIEKNAVLNLHTNCCEMNDFSQKLWYQGYLNLTKVK